MKILDKYIIKQYVVSFIFAIAILAVVSCVIDYVEKINDFVNNKAPFLEILKYYATFVPHIISLLYPLFIFISTIFFTSKLAYRSEFIAMQASGIRLSRILRPYMIGAFFIGSVSLTFNHYLVPMANMTIYNFEEQYIRTSQKTSDNNVHIRLSPDQYVFVYKFNMTSNSGEKFTEENFENDLLREKIFAQQVRYEDSIKTWILSDVTIRKNNGLEESLEKKDTLHRHYKLLPQDFSEDIQRKTAMTSPELYRKSDVDQTRGLENVNAYSYELHRRSSDSAAGLILTIIAVMIATRKIRGGSGLHLAIGIVISAFYMLFMQFAKTFSLNSGLHPMLAAWLPNLAFIVVAYLLFLWRRR